MPIHGEEGIYENVIRLHVIANSDSEADQALKLRVRDRVLALTSEALADCESLEEAEARLDALRGALATAARETMLEEGYNYPVEVTLTKEIYPRKSYDGICFPSGEYLSCRVILGEGEGQNWWCVLFPPLCLSAATKNEQEDAFIAAGFTPNQYKIITESDRPVYKVRFKLLELLQSLW
jgi:stage II sporulation protein R